MDGNLDPPPLPRPRSNTWPLPRPENYADTVVGVKEEACARGAALGGGVFAGPQQAKKNSSRRNAWGNLSYADLITQAITSAPDKRLTLSQIYEWMVHNVPYFKDKGDSNSSAGWKNSIRHNLSLHNRFMRVQNEGTGKSSWWMINPDAKPGKSARRRATSMETSKFEKRRGRVKKKVEQLRAAGADATPSPSSSVSEGLDLFPDSPLHAGFQLSPDFRPRASSNASSCGGRLSPIPAAVGAADWGAYGPEQLAGSLAESMKLHHDYLYQPPPYQQQQAPPPPPPYHHQQPPQPQQQQPPPPQPAAPPTPCTMMGQLMASLNNPALLDDLNLNIETLHGFDCNVDEVIKHELSMDGSLDFNFAASAAHQHHHHLQQPLPQQQHHLQQQQHLQPGPAAPEQPPPGPYASGPSWVH